MEVRVRDLRKSYGQAIAVSDISLRVPEGEMLVLLGPSGCGKTTTMRCIAGLETPDHGTISIGPTPIFDAASGLNVPVNKRRIGMVFQSYAIWPHMTVAENVGYPLDVAKASRADRDARVREVLDVTGLRHLADRGASKLSGGQMQRVALARSLAMRPAVLLYDEPLSNLDARLRDHLRIQLKEIQNRFRITSVYVTHDQKEALSLADQIVVMQAGRIIQSGPPEDVYQSPRCAEVAEFLGFTNIFPAKISGSAGAGTMMQLGERISLAIAASVEQAAGYKICIRPEDIELQPADTASGQNQVAGSVVVSSFLGAQYQFRVKDDDNREWDVLRPATEGRRQPGDRVVLNILPTAIIAVGPA